jgi:hypothetical protein
MNRGNEQEYYMKRAEAELGRAQASGTPEAVKAHYLLAGYYLDRVYNPEEAEAILQAPKPWRV